MKEESGMGEKNPANMEQMVRDRCESCVALVEENGEWICDERELPCRKVITCPEGLKLAAYPEQFMIHTDEKMEPVAPGKEDEYE